MVIKNSDNLTPTPCSTENDSDVSDMEVVEETLSEDNEIEVESEGDLDELLEQLEDYIPTIPDAVTENYMNASGFSTVDPRIVRIISVAAQKFISDIANDALQHCKTRTTNNQHSNSHGSNKDKKISKDRKYVLAMEDLTPALADHAITMRKPQYFV